MSVVTLMRWHVELKRDITEYVLTLRRLSLNYDVRLDIMMLICILAELRARSAPAEHHG